VTVAVTVTVTVIVIVIVIVIVVIFFIAPYSPTGVIGLVTTTVLTLTNKNTK